VRQVDEFYTNKEEPNKSCLLALRDIICKYNPEFEQAVKYGMPCFTMRKKVFCYLWVHKKTTFPYILIRRGVELAAKHPEIVVEDRKNFAIIPIDPNKDIPVETIHRIFASAMQFNE